MGHCAGKSITDGNKNTFLGPLAGNTNTTGSCNVAIGYDVELPSATGNDQFAIGSGTNHWITGNANFNVGIGTTNPDIAVGVGNTAKLSVGILSAYQLYGDGSNLTNVGSASTDAWAQDSNANLVAGTGAGAARDADTCFNVLIGCNSGAALNAGDNNVFLGRQAGQTATTANANVVIGCSYAVGTNTSEHDVFIGENIANYTHNVTGGCNIVSGYYAAYALSTALLSTIDDASHISTPIPSPSIKGIET